MTIPVKHLALAASFAALLTAACDPATQLMSPPQFHNFGSGGSPAAAGDFAVLANAAVTCTDGTITGDVGTFLATPTGSVTQTTCPIIGTVHVGDAASIQAYNDFLTAYDSLAPQPGDVCTTLTGTLDGVTLSPGVYCFPAAAALTGVLTLDGPSDGSWIFKIGTVEPGALTGTNFSVVMAGGGQACNVTWWVDAAATMTDSDLKGNVLAGAAITLTRGTLNGNAWSKADVTVTGTAVTGCGAALHPSCKVSGGRVTGGGWIRGPSGGKASFSVAGGIRQGQFWGHLTYEDEGRKGKHDNVKVKSTGVTGYSVLNGVTGRIEGTAKVNGVAGFTYQVDVTDNGERGRNDTFTLLLSNEYTASGTLGGGNIQLHAKRSGRGCDNGHDDDDDDDDDDDGHRR